MSTEIDGGGVIFCCDTCGETFDSKESDFIEALGEAKRDGWRAYKVADLWCHACPDCRENR